MNERIVRHFQQNKMKFEYSYRIEFVKSKESNISK